MLKTIYINGMQCEHCKMRVEKVLNSINGIKNVSVNLDNKNVVIECEGEIEEDNIKEAVEEIGFEVVDIK